MVKLANKELKFLLISESFFFCSKQKIKIAKKSSKKEHFLGFWPSRRYSKVLAELLRLCNFIPEVIASNSGGLALQLTRPAGNPDLLCGNSSSEYSLSPELLSGEFKIEI